MMISESSRSSLFDFNVFTVRKMKAKTRMFGEIDIQEDKIITLESGMIGFPDMQKFTLIFDEEKGSK